MVLLTMAPSEPSPPFSKSTTAQIEPLRAAGWIINQIAWDNRKERIIRLDARRGPFGIYLVCPEDDLGPRLREFIVTA
jgi:hypothetical protein